MGGAKVLAISLILINLLSNRLFATSEKLLDIPEFPQLTPIASTIKIDKSGATPYIIGGKPASREEYPWYVLILLKSISTGSMSMCGGSLHSDRHVITAAHCIKGNEVVAMQLGVLDRREKNVAYKAESAVIHDEYVAVLHQNDLAVITTDKPVSMGRSVRPISLPGRNETFFGEKGYTIGLGRTQEEGATLPANLLEVNVPIWDLKQCKLHFDPFGIHILDNMLCAGGREKDSCQGDSGGPLNCFSNERKQWELCGVVSWGVGCGREGFPGVYTRITEHLDWINNVVQNYVKWSKDGTAIACDFPGNDISSQTHPADDCLKACKQTTDCTHYAWKPFNQTGNGTVTDHVVESETGNGTCQLKTGPISKPKAIATQNSKTKCGIMPIKWKENEISANGCDFPGNSFAKDNVSAENCRPLCEKTKRCSHYAWTIEKDDGGGTCWLKIGPASKFDAVITADQSMVCGIIDKRDD